MNCSKLIAVLVAPLCIGAAVAQGAGGTNTADMQELTPPLTRAEVIADLQVWRESGMAAAQQVGDGEPDFYGAEYQKAEARYQALRKAPSFAVLVRRIALERGERVETASTK